MPIIINGGSYSAGGWWSKHLQKAETNERVEVVGFDNLSAETIPEAFREMEALAAGTRCKNYFYQANINPRADEHLTPAQRNEAIETLERNLGLTGQPRFVVEHQKEGRTHWHVVWSRIDTERMQAISDSLTAAIHERTSRELEIKFGLERGQSILVPSRDLERPERRPRKSETFRVDRDGIDPETVKVDARAAWERADNGQSFKAALEASGDYVLARGDRRDFVIIDRAGDDHSLARRLGVKAAEIRARMADLDPAILPSVAEAKAQQQARHGMQEPQQRPEPTPETRSAAQEAISPEARRPAARPDPEMKTAEHGVTRLLGGIAGMAAKAFDFLADMIAPSPPPTKEEVRQQQRAEAEERPLREAARSQAEWEARLADRLDEDARRRRRREPGQEHERDDDRGRERDRS